jgi:myo-inositol 2-dehydrogenase/D-chiro-inositol 1-dehydrogenase
VNARVGIGIVGVGRMGARHARIIARGVPAARLIALADIHVPAARRLAEELRVPRVYESAGELAADPDIQAVVIVVSTSDHLDAIRAVAAEGRDILCEKPLALTLADTDEAIAAASAAGVRLQVGFMRRWDPEYRRVFDALASGACGTPILFSSFQFDGGPPPLSYADPAVSGGIMIDMGIHDFDLARWLMSDEVVEVQAWGSTLAFPEFAAVDDVDSAVINLRYAGEALGTIALARCNAGGDEVRTEVQGTAGSVHYGERVIASERREPLFESAYRAESEAFVRAIADDAPVAVGGFEARAALVIALAADRSRREGRPIDVAAEVSPA